MIYLDPPYLNGTRTSRGNYATDNGGMAFHERLIEALIDHPAAILLSGYAATGSPYERLGWKRHETIVSAHVSNRTGARRVECLWANRPRIRVAD